jgi:cyclohexadienyl dehydratase
MLYCDAVDIRCALRTALLGAVSVVLVGLGANAQTGGAGSVLDILIQRGTVQVCTTGDYKPFTFHKIEADSYEGIDIEMAKSLARAIGVQPQFVKTKWSELMADFTSGKCDIAMGGISVTLNARNALFLVRRISSMGRLQSPVVPIRRSFSL